MKRQRWIFLPRQCPGGRLHRAVDAGEPTALIPNSGRGELRIEVLYHTCFAAGTRPGAILLRNDGALVVETGIRVLALTPN
ncbi:hypothetical protein D3C84_223750 [compost metagenome]